MDQWLVRTQQGFILGPYTKAQTLELIAHGKLSLEDEISQANEYWFSLSDREEVLKYLSVELQLWRLPKLKDDERTETETTLLMSTANKNIKNNETTVYTRTFVRQPFLIAARWILLIFVIVLFVATLRLMGKLRF
ncbi:MAG: hypothetical protein HY843_08220 [Bdellovibrio sp.]|nr:hypothetical protein [Bdellovibrio sp.]